MTQDNSLWVRRSKTNKWFLWLMFLLSVGLIVFVWFGYSKYDKGITDGQLLVEQEKSVVEDGGGEMESVDGGVGETSLVNGVKNGPATLVIYNGTAKIGISGKYASELSSRSDIEILDKQNASKRDYPRTFVVNINGNTLATARDLAHKLDAPVVEIMPDGESTPSADILVILGGDYR